MNPQKMTIHRALAELKTIEARIRSKIELFDPIGMARKGQKVNNFWELDDFNKRAPADLQGIEDLMKRKDRIKSAIVLSNALTEVKIGGEVMKVSDAISKKATVELQKLLILRMQNRKNATEAEVNRQNEHAEEVSNKLAETALNKPGIDTKSPDALTVIKPYMDSHKYDIIDPLNLGELIGKKLEEVTNFEAEVDAILSESNALTIIEA